MMPGPPSSFNGISRYSNNKSDSCGIESLRGPDSVPTVSAPLNKVKRGGTLSVSAIFLATDQSDD